MFLAGPTRLSNLKQHLDQFGTVHGSESLYFAVRVDTRSTPDWKKIIFLQHWGSAGQRHSPVTRWPDPHCQLRTRPSFDERGFFRREVRDRSYIGREARRTRHRRYRRHTYHTDSVAGTRRYCTHPQRKRIRRINSHSYGTVARLRWPVTVIPQIYFPLHVRTSTMSTFARRTPRSHVELDVLTYMWLTCARGVENKSAVWP